VVAFRFDPNAGDPEPRKAIGCSHAVWHEQLAELFSASAPTESDAAPDRIGMNRNPLHLYLLFAVDCWFALIVK
jgi:hypothetical protein